MLEKPIDSVDIIVDIELPKLYNVIFYNDDFTTMEFVVYALMAFFEKELGQAIDLMTKIHNSGSCNVATYSYDIAHTKKNQVDNSSKENGFPLKVTVEEVV